MTAEHEAQRDGEPRDIFSLTREWYDLCATVLLEGDTETITTPTHAVRLRWGERSPQPSQQVVPSGPNVAEVDVTPLAEADRRARARISPRGEMLFALSPQDDFGIPQVLALTTTDQTQGTRLVALAQPFFDAIAESQAAQDTTLPPEQKAVLDAQLASWYEKGITLLLDKGNSNPPRNSIYWLEQILLIKDQLYTIHFSLNTFLYNKGEGVLSIDISKRRPPLPMDGGEQEQRRRLENPDHIGNRNFRIRENGEAQSSYVTKNKMIYELEDHTHVKYAEDKPYTVGHKRELAYLFQFIDPILFPPEK